MVADQVIKDRYALYLGDCVEVARDIPDNSIGYSIFSPPFSSLYTYSGFDRDMGNVEDDEQFMEGFRYLVRELYRITKPGRSVSFHCMDLPARKSIEGYIGLKDFPSLLIKAFEAEGFIYHSKVTIWKNPVVEMQRTKALGLLHKTIRKDSSMSRVGLPDYLVTMRKPGENPEPITHTHESFSVNQWQQWASPVWMDISQTNVLNGKVAREEKDERHICPLQLEVIERGIELWSNPDDIVFDPFGGIGSTPYMALKMGRRALASELKESYFKQMTKNCETALQSEQMEQGELF